MAGLDDLIGTLTSAAGAAAGAASGAAGAAAGAASGAAGAAAGAASALDPGKLGALVAPLMGVISERGGLQSVVDQLQGSGIGEQVTSWLGSGPSLPVSPDDLLAAAPDAVKEIAGKAGVSVTEAATGLAALLPGLVGALTQDGKVPGADQLAGLVSALPGGDAITGMLGGLLGGSSPSA